MKVAIIGCGYSGLSAIRRCVEFGIDCVAFELSGQVGGQWVYSDRVGCDEFGIPIQTSLYDNLRTNSPKQILELPDFKFVTKEDTSYPHHTEVRRYLEDFAKHFDLTPHIKFHHYVNLVSRSNQQWTVEVTNLETAFSEIYYFDSVIVCNGHTSKPFTPQIRGSESFRGLQLHSHDYRRHSVFADKNVLVVGVGPSGLEIAYESSLVAKTTYLSDRHHCQIDHPTIVLKSEVLEIREEEVVFTDGTSVTVDVIIYCTGYVYDYPFLDSSCGISVVEDGQIVQHLYKHYINIAEPTMCFIGLFQRVIVSYLFDLQVQAFLKFLTNQIELPTKSSMLAWLNAENERKKRLNIPANRYYHLSVDIEEYFEDITMYAKLRNIPPVLFKIFRQNEQMYTENFYDLRRCYFTILDDNNYSMVTQPLKTTMKVAIIGAGPAGLASARRALEYNLDCTVFEMTGNIGGTWVYSEINDPGETESVLNPLYADLRTNLPVHLMEFPGFKFKPKSGLCYPHHEDVRAYLDDFANEFKLHSCIKLHCQVVNVVRHGDKWRLLAKNLKNSSYTEYIFDSVIICNGHFTKPFIPDLPGMDTFKGHLIHSLYYRRRNNYKGKRVLIVGAAASGRDIARECAAVANKVILSYGSNVCDLDGNVEMKPRLCSINNNEVLFADGTSTTVDSIIMCTGYHYDFPFLHESCGIEVEEGRIVKPLYRQMINITHPSMCFIGLLQKTFLFQLMDLQAEVFMKILTKKVDLPSTSTMLKSLDEENRRILTANASKACYYYLRARVKDYFDDLATFGNIKSLPCVIFKMYEANEQAMSKDFWNFRNKTFEVIDDNTFVVSRLEKNSKNKDPMNKCLYISYCDE